MEWRTHMKADAIGRDCVFKVSLYSDTENVNIVPLILIIIIDWFTQTWLDIKHKYHDCASVFLNCLFSLLLRRILDILLDRFLPVFGTVDTGNGWHSQVCPHAIGGINTCHKMRHSLSVCHHSHMHLYGRASTFSSWPDIVISLLSADSNSSKWTRTNRCRWPSVHLGWSLCPAPQLIDHQGRSTHLPTMWYENIVLRW